MKHIILILLILSATTTRSQVLYTLTGKNLKGESYLLFVDNMLPTSSLIGVKDVFKCYNRSNVVVCEYVGDASFRNVEMLMESSSRLSESLSHDEIAMVDSVLRADCKMELSRLERLKPAAVRMMWESEICRSLYQRGDDDMEMDSYFQQVALFENKKIVALDDSVHSYGYLSEPVGIQARKMVDALRKGRNSVVQRYRRAESLYKNEDVLGLAVLQNDEQQPSDTDARVDGWIDRIINTISSERSFIVLPARYFNGGLIDKLKKHGIKIKEVK